MNVSAPIMGEGSAAREPGGSVLTMKDCEARFEQPGQEPYVAVRGIDLAADVGTFTSVVGPTGCGKSTILNMAAGLLKPASGAVDVNGQRLRGINTTAGYLFQQDALLPWKSALDNVALALRYSGTPRRAARNKAIDWLDRVGLKHFADRYPAQLSGGQRRRVAMAQMWIKQPQLILMDEPFSALDAQTRLIMQSELLGLWSTIGGSVLFVTHDLDEAVAMSDEIVVLSAGPASHVAGRFHVSIDRPRNLLDVKQTEAYRETYDQVWECLKAEVIKTQEKNASA
ncbi:ABC transporter ATP-binding protein [Spelaeicoccus albus]|uniref:NitT/TauT family transport system ATP-binding protein n=1 Tax=Spelaeicoccus albus TaxID=1280376 RepID=A0A7Z0A9M4_9MICO|nr:ABC transporter ATP-binding protein [Spelaeicoccus albus]NYI66952.1 NitT/TauT family transport system ATP-binding protein [Spelaeicoccus albus]